MPALRKLLSSVELLWAISFAAQAVTCAVLFLRRHQRALPWFTLCIVLNLSQAVFLYVTYRRYGFGSPVAYVFAWRSQGITLLARGLATMEALRLTLKSYPGIWKMTWRVLTAVSGVVLIGIALAAHGDEAWALMEADRGCHLIFATTALTFLILIRYYFIDVATVYKALVVGFCLNSCVSVLLNTVLHDVLYPRFKNYESIWQTGGLLSFLIVQAIWIRALNHPLPARSDTVQLLPASEYQRIRPAINYQLQAMNERLADLGKVEEPGN